MPTIIPFVPQQITVHLGTPGADAENVTELIVPSLNLIDVVYVVPTENLFRYCPNTPPAAPVAVTYPLLNVKEPLVVINHRSAV